MDISGYASEWVNPENISVDKENPTKATILDEGEETESRFGVKPVFNIKIDGNKFKYRPSKTALKSITKKYGAETRDWVEKEINIISVDMVFPDGVKKVVVVV